MNLEVSDPYIWLENINDPRVIKWALERDMKVHEKLGKCSKLLIKKLSSYYNIPLIQRVVVGRSGYYALMRDAKSFKIIRIHENGDFKEIISSSDLGDDVVIKSLQAFHDENILAFSYSIGGSDVGYTILINPDNKETIDKLYGVVSSIVWIGDNKYYYVRVYYDQKTPDNIEPPATRVFLRENGKEELVFGHGLPSLYFIGIAKSTDSSRAFVTISYGWTRTDIYAGPLLDPDEWSFLYGGGEFISYPIDYTQGRYLLVSYDDLDGMGRVISIDENKNMTEIVRPHKYPLQGALLVEDRIIVHYLLDASSYLRIYDLGGAIRGEIEFNPKGFISSMDTDGKRCILKYESFTIPYRIYVFLNGELRCIKSIELNNKYIVEEAWVRSSDGTPIHFFRVRNREKNIGTVLAYGYGGYRISMVPVYTPLIMPLLDDGGEYVVANIRGGGEYGEKWHRDGIRERKQNVFNDFIAILEYLKRKEGKRVFAYGVSNGGLLVGAVLTQRPDVIDGAIIGYPVLDMMRFHKLFIGRLWITEFGDPDDPEDREYLLRYSPYHNLKPGVKYPPAMLITGLKDDRVHPSHAFKFAAKLEELGSECLLRVEEESGHSGASPARKISEYADILSFIYMNTGICD